MKKEKSVVQEENSENNPTDNEEDLLYTHKSESKDNTMRWNSSLCKRPGH
ncbi:hypothetical protein [Methanosarcina sp. UBA5]|nr:hypothetical protein [Methanosarcina sp. UBA5]